MTEPLSAPDTPPKKPWYRKPWIWAVIVGLLLVGGIANLVNGDERENAQVEPTPTATETSAPAEAVEEPSAEPEPSVDEEARAAALEQAIKDSYGGQEYAEVYASDPSLWYGYINGVRTEGSNAFITLQLAADDPNRDTLGERAAQALSTLLPASAVEGISFLIIEDASGTVIDQTQPRPLS